MKKRILGIMLSVVMLSGCGAVANNNVPAMTYSAENEYMQLAIEKIYLKQ